MRLPTARDVVDKFREYRAAVEKQLSLSIKAVRSDNGGEYIGELRRELVRDGIRVETSAPYTPEQNGVAERMNRTLVESARSMIHAQGLGQEYWAEAVVAAAYIRNRVISRSTDGKSPHELWYGKKPTVRHLRVWGCTAYAHVAQEKRSKFDAKAVKCIMIGYSESSKAWRLWDTERKRLIVSRDVTFNEFITVNVSSVVTQSVAAETVEVPVTSVQPPTEQHNEEKQPAEEPVEQPVAVAVGGQEQAAQPVGEVVDSVRRSARHHRLLKVMQVVRFRARNGAQTR